MKGVALALATVVLAGAARGEVVRVAVAANFTAAMEAIADRFERDSGHTVVVSYGSTGKLYAQIRHGAPFDLYLAADQGRPLRLEGAGRASGRYTYAIGRLVLWSADPTRPVDAEALRAGDFRKLAIANPKTAPYGAAAIEVLRNLGLEARLRPKLVRGDNIAQTYQFVATGNAELGFVARAQIALDDQGAHWLVPQAFHGPLRQDLVLLERARDNPAARALHAYLRSDGVRALVRRFGYATE
jgi:molybdate transport system substrate-binding protein